MNAKQSAASAAVQRVSNDMIVGLGTGSTASFAIALIGDRVKEGLSIKAVASSRRSERLAASLGIAIVPFTEVDRIDLYIDGADEVDEHCNLIKGGGGALTREKILAWQSRKFIVIVDASKLVKKLGRFRVPVEVLPFASELTARSLENLGAKTSWRMEGGAAYFTDNGNPIVDCDFGLIDNPEALGESIDHIPGVVTQGIFPRTMVHEVIVGHDDGSVRYMKG